MVDGEVDSGPLAVSDGEVGAEDALGGEVEVAGVLVVDRLAVKVTDRLFFTPSALATVRVKMCCWAEQANGTDTLPPGPTEGGRSGP